MNKPDITDGTWIYDGKTQIYTSDSEDILCWLEEFILEYKHEQIANGKAISAVPEMIDALCMVWEELQSKEDWGKDLSPSQIEQIHNTLRKAGVKV